MTKEQTYDRFKGMTLSKDRRVSTKEYLDSGLTLHKLNKLLGVISPWYQKNHSSLDGNARNNVLCNMANLDNAITSLMI